ncbi:hypothetical protein SAMN04489806_0200 [Paramicrobacterium humi]|uniref:Uncharacterized protein n=2 Tax=Paramicrobacterium humi TaxID=640635 RepID=A0A1H4IU47_9MICO|nr:hypothetical protein [Microbacterium humi]SEB36752.1 hypothetical protein SAMN04489806_0200 [Microbacterium humi]
MLARRIAVTSLSLIAAAALAGCAPESPASTPSPSATSASPMPSPTDTETLTPTPEPSATSTAAEGWTKQALYDACVDYNGAWASENGYDPQQFTWDPYSDAMVGSEGAVWYVSLTGTIRVDSKDVQAEFECAITGKPANPVVKAVER